MKNLPNFKTYGYHFQGYVARIHSYQSYFKHSMNILRPEIYQELFFQNGSIYTKVKDEPPAKYLKNCAVKNSLVANGSVIGGDVENSVLFRGVKIKPGAKVTNSILMQKVSIGKDVILENVICDKDVRIGDGKKLRGEINHPIVIEKGSVI
jgi:glucose-1-phosphate adenylyltransferase